MGKDNDWIRNAIGVIASLIGAYFVYLSINWLFSNLNAGRNFDFFTTVLNMLGPFLILIGGLLFIPRVRKLIGFMNRLSNGSQILISVILIVAGFLFIIAVPFSKLY